MLMYDFFRQQQRQCKRINDKVYLVTWWGNQGNTVKTMIIRIKEHFLKVVQGNSLSFTSTVFCIANRRKGITIARFSILAEF